MTRQESKRLYLSVFDDCGYSLEWEAIHEEMEAVVAATSDRAAGKVIAWWGCWSRNETATAAARKLRESWARKVNKGRKVKR